MANATKYVDNVLGSNSNTGDNPGSGATGAYADVASAQAAITGGGNVIYVKNTGTPYASAATVTWTAALKGDLTDGRNRIEGYTTTPGALDGRPTVSCSGSGVAVWTFNDNDYWTIRHFNVTHTHASVKGLAFAFVTSASDFFVFDDVVVDGCLAMMTQASNMIGNPILRGCEVKNCTSTAGAVSCGSFIYMDGCDIHNNAGDGFRGSTGVSQIFAFDTLFTGNAGMGLNSVSNSTVLVTTVYGCLFADNTSHGLLTTASAGAQVLALKNNVFYGNGGYGVTVGDTLVETTAVARINRCNAYGSNTSGDRSNLATGLGDVSLSADPFVNRAGRDYTRNTTSGGGLALKEAGFPRTYPSGTTTNYKDIGVQHQDGTGAATGGGAQIIGSPIISGGGVSDMSIRTGQVVVVEFTTANFTTGAAANAGSTPVGTVVVNGTDNAAAVAVANVDTGRYKATFTVPTVALDDRVELSIAATVGGVAAKGIVWRGARTIASDANGKVPATVAAGDLATDSITAAALKSDAVTEIQTGLATAAAQTTLAALVAALGSPMQTGDTTVTRKTDLPTNFTGAKIDPDGLFQANLKEVNDEAFEVDQDVTGATFADALLGRNAAGGSNGGLTVGKLLRGVIPKFAFSSDGTQLIVYAEDGTTQLGVFNVGRLANTIGGVRSATQTGP